MAQTQATSAAKMILFVCSNDTHVRTFEPVARELESKGLSCVFESLDGFYGHGASQTGAALGRNVRPLAEPDISLGRRGFYARSPMSIWRDVIRTRRPLETRLADLDPSVLVLGNDSGLVEKSVIDLARRAGIATVLVQDGRISWRRPTPKSWRRRSFGLAKRATSPLLVWSGRPYLAASQYGEGGVNLALASGPVGARILTARAKPNTRVVIAGQPRYDPLIELLARPAPKGRLLIMLTTPFMQTGLGPSSQLAQDRFVEGVARAVTDIGIAFAVKPHPREDPEHYRQLIGADAVKTEDPSEVLHQADVALIGMSSMVEEAGILRRPVLVPGSVVHDRSYEPSLPDRASYPRVDSADDVCEWLTRLADPNVRNELLDRQAAIVAEEVSFYPGERASVRVAAHISQLIESRSDRK
jgi:hypothetical protein